MGQWLSYTFNVDLPTCSKLQARSWCLGKRIDLTFTIPENVERISIRRSKFAFSTFVEDPAKILYEGPPENLDSSPMTTFVDGIFTNPVIRSTGEALEENTFYYYTIFVSYGEVNGERAWITDDNAQVQCLSIKEYPENWFYNLLPEHYRKTDADPKRGQDQYKLRDYCSVLQCGLNLQRGWLEGLLKLKDPETMPAGRLGEASNQLCVLGAESASLGMPPERTFDAGVLRQIISGIVSVYKKKGACPGLVQFVKLFTRWDSRCDEINLPRCGVNRLFRLWDTNSYIRQAICDLPGELDITTLGQAVIDPAQITYANGDPLPTPTLAKEAFKFIIDALGTFYCIDSLSGENPLTIYFADSDTKVRAEIGAPGALSGPGQFQINSTYPVTDFGGWPWQFSDAAPAFAQNALKGLKLLDSANVKHTIAGNEPTSFITNLFIEPGTGDPADGDVYIAYDFTLGATQADRLPIWKGRLYAGEFSLTYHPSWDSRHFIEETVAGPFSVFAGFGSPGAFGPSATPSDIVLWIANQHEIISRVTSVTTNTLVDSTAAWTNNQWYGYYVLPSWEQTSVFRIIGNNSNTLVVETRGNRTINRATSIGQEFVILNAQNAFKYTQLCQALPSFAPIDSRIFVKFEEVP